MAATMAEQLNQFDYLEQAVCCLLKIEVNEKLRIKHLANEVSFVINSVVNFVVNCACHQNGLSTCHLLECASTRPIHL